MASETSKDLHTEYLAKPSYSFLRTIAEGSSGLSRLWFHDVLGIRVVSKTVALFGEPGGVARGEPRLLKQLNHPRLVKLLEAQWSPDQDPSLKAVTFTTEYCEGRSVETALGEGHQFSVNEALTIVADVLDALDYMHEEHAYIHRDVKPGNVMLDRSRSRGYLGDLGSVAEIDEHGHVPARAGTPLYRAPESRDAVVSVAADIYGVGMVALEMLNGPFPYQDLDFDKIDARLDEGRRALVDKYFAPEPWVPPKAATLVRAMCARDPGRRPSSAAKALRLVRDAKCVDWRRVEGIGLLGRWQGTWPPGQPARRRRLYEASAEAITAGPNKGKIKLRAARRTPTSTWRYLARLETRIDAGDAPGLADFFRAVEHQAAAAR